MIYDNFGHSLSIDHCLEEITFALVNVCQHHTTISTWYRKCKKKFYLEDVELISRARTFIMEKKVNDMRKMLDED